MTVFLLQFVRNPQSLKHDVKTNAASFGTLANTEFVNPWPSMFLQNENECRAVWEEALDSRNYDDLWHHKRIERQLRCASRCLDPLSFPLRDFRFPNLDFLVGSSSPLMSREYLGGKVLPSARKIVKETIPIADRMVFNVLKDVTKNEIRQLQMGQPRRV